MVVEDDPTELAAVLAMIERPGIESRGCTSLESALDSFESFAPHLVLSDLEFPDGSGLTLLPKVRSTPNCEVVYVTGKATIDAAVSALRSGALDFLTKPVDVQRLEQLISGLGEAGPDVEHRVRTLDEAERTASFGPLVGRSPQMLRVYQQILRVAPTMASVLVQGETGTGKELIAETIHELSERRHEPFVPLNCGAVSATLIESELFGHEKGSFTGANRRHLGVFERACGGTLFLDEITEMPQELQVKLLRVLESRQFQRVGGEESIPCDSRIVAATNRVPEEAVRDGKLREDLLYRLRVFPIQLPPLRARDGDVRLLAERFLAQLAQEHGATKSFAPEALDHLESLKFPGNVRELKNLVYRAYILADGIVSPEHLVEGEQLKAPEHDDTTVEEIRVRVGSTIAAAEKSLILATLDRYRGDKHKAARVLGISVKTLYTRLAVYSATAREAGTAEA